MHNRGVQIQMWDRDVRIQVEGSMNARRVVNRLRHQGIEVRRVSQLDGTSHVLISMRCSQNMTFTKLRALIADMPGLTIPF
ncbi:MAG: hypothetical protein O3A00_13005 [Planctomycetota bacterium]|nr:hypothetical protein [Planctomycetota bacterium]